MPFVVYEVVVEEIQYVANNEFLFSVTYYMIGGADTYDNDIYYWMDGSLVEDGYVKYLNSYCMYTLPMDQLFNLEFQPKFGIQLGIPIPMGKNLGQCIVRYIHLA